MTSNQLFFFDESKTGKLASSMDWSKTNLGPAENWPHELKIILGMMYSNRQPISLFWGPEKNYFYNDSYIPIVGASKHPQMMGVKGEVVWKEIWDILLPQIDYVMKERGATWNVDQYLPILGDNGELRDAYFTYSYSPVYLTDGTVGGTLVTCTETTEKVKAEKNIILAHAKAEESRKVLYDFFMQSPVPMVILLGPEYHFTLANPPYEKLIGRKAMGKDLLEIYTRDEVKDFIPLLDGVYQTGTPYIGRELPLFISDDNDGMLKLWIDVGYHPFRDDNGKIQGILAIVQDVSDHKLARESVEIEKQKFESIFVDSPAAMALLRGPTFIFEKINTSYHQLMGGRDILGKTRREALPELNDQPFNQLLTEVFNTGKPFVAREMLAKLIRKIGDEPEETYFDFTYSRVVDGKNEPYGIYIHASDVTDKVKSRQKIQEAVRVRDEFLSIASHELKTPITSLKMQLQLAQKGLSAPSKNPTEMLSKSVNISLKQVERLTSLVDDLLDVTRLESGKMHYNFAPTDITELVREVVERYPDLTFKKLENMKNDEKVMVSCDRFRMEQVFTNLINNAIKYGDGKPVAISFETTKSHARINVHDEGIGIPENLQNKIFQRFERVISNTNIKGLGLGLYISKQIVDAHHGSVMVKSEVGKGSTFSVELQRI